MRSLTTTLIALATSSLLATSALAAPPAAPAPAEFVASEMSAGDPGTLTWINLPAGAKVIFGVSTLGADGGPCSAQLDTCIDLEEPATVGTAVADAQGTARLDLTVPAGLDDGRVLYFQAVATDPGTKAMLSEVYKRISGEATCKNAVFVPVCGADGQTHLNRCEAEAHGQAVQFTGKCN